MNYCVSKKKKKYKIAQVFRILYRRTHMVVSVTNKDIGKSIDRQSENYFPEKNHVFTVMEGEIKLADTNPSLFSPRFRESSLGELRDWSTLLEGEPSRASRIPSRPPRRMYTVESRLSRWLLLLPPLY